MGDLLIRNIDEALKRGIIELAQANGRSLSDEAKVLIGEAMAGKWSEPADSQSVVDTIRAIFEREGAIGDEYADLMDEVEAERKKDFGRPFEAFE